MAVKSPTRVVTELEVALEGKPKPNPPKTKVFSKRGMVIDRVSGQGYCLLYEPHGPHDWIYTSEGGGHMIDPAYAGADDKEWHCPGWTAEDMP